MMSSKLDRCFVAESTHATNNRSGLVLEVTVMSPRLPCVHIRYVHLHEGYVDTEEGVSNGDTCVCEGARVDNDRVNIAPPFLDAVDDGALPVGLEGIELNVELGALGACSCDHVFECDVSIEVWFAGPEQVKVWTIDEKDAAAHYGQYVKGLVVSGKLKY